jgi:hypothetical protein
VTTFLYLTRIEFWSSRKQRLNSTGSFKVLQLFQGSSNKYRRVGIKLLALLSSDGGHATLPPRKESALGEVLRIPYAKRKLYSEETH